VLQVSARLPCTDDEVPQRDLKQQVEYRAHWHSETSEISDSQDQLLKKHGLNICPKDLRVCAKAVLQNYMPSRANAAAQTTVNVATAKTTTATVAITVARVAIAAALATTVPATVATTIATTTTMAAATTIIDATTITTIAATVAYLQPLSSADDEQPTFCHEIVVQRRISLLVLSSICCSQRY